jgi:hypothetical protein
VAGKVRGWLHYPTGLFIRDYLLEHGEAYPQEIWRALKEKRKRLGVAYGSVRSFHLNYIYVLKKLGLIEPVRHEKVNPKWFARTYYRIVPGMENSPLWSAPQIALDPRRGKPYIRRRYAKERAKKMVPKPITPEELERIWNAASAFLKEKGYVISREEFETIKPEWPSEAGLYPTFEERVGYVIRQAAGIAYISRLARRLTSVEEAPEPFRSEAIKHGRTLEKEWLRRKGKG